MLVGYAHKRVSGFYLLRPNWAEILRDDSRGVYVLEENIIQFFSTLEW